MSLCGTEELADALMWKEVLLLSCVKPGETVCVLTGANSNDRNFRAAMHASQELGAIVFQLHIPSRLPHKTVGADRTAYVGVTPITGNAAPTQTLKNVDFVAGAMVIDGDVVAVGQRVEGAAAQICRSPLAAE